MKYAEYKKFYYNLSNKFAFVENKYKTYYAIT